LRPEAEGALEAGVCAQQGRGSTASASPRRRAGGDAQLLDYLERFLSFQPSNDASERTGQPADVFVKWKIFFSRRGRR
jgi:hypothetical protein